MLTYQKTRQYYEVQKVRNHDADVFVQLAVYDAYAVDLANRVLSY